jgi:hypothetical protein
MLLLGLCLARDLLDAPLPGEVVEELARDPVVASLALSIRTRILSPRTAAFSFSERLRFDFAVRERGRDRLAYGVARLLTPSDRDLVATPPALRILRVPIRLFRLAGRYLLNPSRGKAFLLGTDDRSDPSGVTREGDR